MTENDIKEAVERLIGAKIGQSVWFNKARFDEKFKRVGTDTKKGVIKAVMVQVGSGDLTNNTLISVKTKGSPEPETAFRVYATKKEAIDKIDSEFQDIWGV